MLIYSSGISEPGDETTDRTLSLFLLFHSLKQEKKNENVKKCMTGW